MADLIDRDALLKDLRSECPESDVCFSHESCIDCIVKRQPAVNRWIPCSERLPNNRERVLVCFRSGTVHIAVWYGDYDEKGTWKVTSQFPTKLYRTDTIPKWMPMPDAYEPPEREVTQDE